MKNLIASIALLVSVCQIGNAQLQNQFYTGSSIGFSMEKRSNKSESAIIQNIEYWKRSMNLTPQIWYGVHKNISVGAAFGYQFSRSFQSNTTANDETISRNNAQEYSYNGGIQYIYPASEKIYIVSTLMGGITNEYSQSKIEYKMGFYSISESKSSISQANGTLSIGLLYRPSEHWMWQVSSNFIHYQHYIKSRLELSSNETFIPYAKSSQIFFNPNLSSLAVSAFYVF